MAIPLELQVQIALSGLENLQRVQQGIQATVVQTAAATGMGVLSKGMDSVAASAGFMSRTLFFSMKGLRDLSVQAGQVTPAALDLMAAGFERARMEVIEQSYAFELLSVRGAELNAIIANLAPAEWQLQAGLKLTVKELRDKALALQATTQHTVELEQATRRATAATRERSKPMYQVVNAMNIMGSTTQGLMMAMSALQGNVMGVGFSLIFLRFTLASITLGVAALALAIGGTIKGLGFIGQVFDGLSAGPLERIKAALVETWGYLAGPVWLRMILPLLATLADMAEAFRDIAAEVWLSAEVQKNWLEVGLLFSAFMADLNSLFKEHGEMLRWAVRTGFITVLNVIKGLIWTGRILLEVLLSLAGAWRALSILLKPIWSLLGLVSQALKAIGFGDAIREAKEWSLDFPEIMKTALLMGAQYLLGGPKQALLGALAMFIGDLLIGLLPLEPGVRDTIHRAFDWIMLSTAIGAMFGPAGVAIGAWTGLLIGILDTVFKGRITSWFEENLPYIFSGAAIGAAISSIIPGVGTAIGALAGAIAGALWGWIWPLREQIWDWFDALTDSIFIGLERMAEDILSWYVEGLGRYLILPAARPGLAAQLKEVRAILAERDRVMGPRPVAVGPGAYPGIYAGAAGGVPVAQVTITGNQFYGSLDQRTVEVWSQQLGNQVVSRLSGRWGIGIR